MSFFSGRRQPELPPAPSQTSERKLPISVSAQQPVGFETVLGANSVLEGRFNSTANVRLDGTFTGTLEIIGNVLVGETARITADINARNISIAGAVRGNVSGKKVQILRTGRVWGDIHAQALTTEEGAFIDGKITMTRTDVVEEPLGESASPATMNVAPHTDVQAAQPSESTAAGTDSSSNSAVAEASDSERTELTGQTDESAQDEPDAH